MSAMCLVLGNLYLSVPLSSHSIPIKTHEVGTAGMPSLQLRVLRDNEAKELVPVKQDGRGQGTTFKRMT